MVSGKNTRNPPHTNFHVRLRDVEKAMKQIVPSGARNVVTLGRPMPSEEMVLMEEDLRSAQKALERVLPSEFNYRSPGELTN